LYYIVINRESRKKQRNQWRRGEKRKRARDGKPKNFEIKLFREREEDEMKSEEEKRMKTNL